MSCSCVVAHHWTAPLCILALGDRWSHWEHAPFTIENFTITTDSGGDVPWDIDLSGVRAMHEQFYVQGVLGQVSHRMRTLLASVPARLRFQCPTCTYPSVPVVCPRTRPLCGVTQGSMFAPPLPLFPLAVLAAQIGEHAISVTLPSGSEPIPDPWASSVILQPSLV